MVKVSVIMPVYNSEEYLAAAIESVLSQSLQEIELILVDDGSVDQSGKICDRYAESDRRVKVLHQKNGGICAARNRGLDMAQGEYLAFADNDDLCLPGWLEGNYEAAHAAVADIIKFGRISEWIDFQGNITARNIRNLTESKLSKQDIQKQYFELRNEGVFSPVWDGLFKRDLVVEHGIRFNTVFKMGEEDTAFCLLCLLHTSCFVTCRGVYYKHYVRMGKSTSSKFRQDALDKFIQSGLYEDKIIKRLKPEGTREQCLLSHVQNQLLPLFLLLVSDSCTWDHSRKNQYLNQIYDMESKFFAELCWKKAFKQDLKKALVAWLFYFKHYSILFKVVFAYGKMMEYRMKKAVR